MTSIGTLTLRKVALKREPGYPQGVTAPLFIECCKAHIPHGDTMTCPVCGRVFDSAGWVIAGPTNGHE